ncbi:beta-1,4-glucuronyltransferase 1-like isoform X1 [Ischnura elegans]|uniref:beta-1,4-glucuronyltransferase 1-like isoform X1 n=1 Tax=Ischnura elegans TaxID=197161 RepID=UPI001ED86EE3|nr:beta-1,4-glucuronyltransferase 1-like isoform X1 [Ischnura elegans]XP_046389795.1 beta-1,4-glucuronyltransferase 1-like isoform X1 [Ischnura elegans]XP_046389796.1 beta-1,4-glucuronyltransferase 1-like isoform X1 [Ischnura elegans]XP_046389797.1 beta-1,4-glucuronyltransferase 1-like isoform X1 [Ischnura elegans]
MYWRKRLLSRRWYSICGLMVFGPLILALALLVVANLLLQLLLSSQPPQWAAPFTMHRAAVSHLDTSGRYKVLPFAVVGEDWANVTLHPVCLATHASLGAVSDLLETLNSWAGPASVTVFDSDPSLEGAARFLRLIKQCGPRAFPLVSFHVIGPVGVERWRWTNSSVPSHWWLGGTEDWVGAGDDWCRGETRGRQVKAEKQQVKNETVYPQNLARNTALRSCGSPWVLTVDADMVPPPSLRRRLGDFLQRHTGEAEGRRAYVVPTYEVMRLNGSTGLPPDTKADLLKLKKEKKARPFHIKIFKPNQGASNLVKWEARKAANGSGEEEISVAYSVGHFPFWYEPVYVVRPTSGDLPPFDERFVGFGMTRNTQAYEMVLRGYTFEVLDNAFLVHWGFQEFKQRPKWRTKQVQRNYQFFKKWLLEKAAQYDADPENLIQRMAGDQSKRNVVVQRRMEPRVTTKKANGQKTSVTT